MHLDLRLPLPLLRSQLETALDSVAEGVRSGIQVQPQGEMQLSGREGRLISLVPVRITANSDFLGVGKALRGNFRPAALLTFDLAVEFRTRLRVLSDWRLQAQSEVAYQWTKAPATGLGLIPLPVKDLVKPTLERELRKIGQQIDAWVPELTDLPARIQEAWSELQRPLPLDEPLHLRLRPRKEPIPVGELRVEGQVLRVEAQLPLRGTVSLPEDLQSLPFVPLGEAIALVDQAESRLILQVHLPWAQLQRDMSGLDHEDHSLKQPIYLSWGQMDLAGEGKHFSLETRFRLRGLPVLRNRILSGLAQLRWQWGIDPDSGELAVEDLQVKLREVPPWLQTIWPVLRPLLRSLMTRAVRSAIWQQIQATRQEVEAMLEDYALPTGARLQGRIQDLEILDLHGDTQGLHAKVRLSGEARVIITEIT